MNFLKKLFLFCPVPEDQKPIQEYISLKENLFFSWTIKKNKSYIFSVLFLYLSFVFLIFISTLKLTIESLFFTNLIFNILFLLIIFRFIDLKKRFENSKVIYEEGSWYDTQIWEKPFSIIKNDKLISKQKIEPFLKRLYKTNFYFLFILIFLLIVKIYFRD